MKRWPGTGRCRWMIARSSIARRSAFVSTAPSSCARCDCTVESTGFTDAVKHQSGDVLAEYGGFSGALRNAEAVSFYEKCGFHHDPRNVGESDHVPMEKRLNEGAG